MYACLWWYNQMETVSALLALCAGNSMIIGEFPSQRPSTRSFGVFFDLRLDKRLSKQSRCRTFERESRSLWRYCNVHVGGADVSTIMICVYGNEKIANSFIQNLRASRYILDYKKIRMKSSFKSRKPDGSCTIILQGILSVILDMDAKMWELWLMNCGKYNLVNSTRKAVISI